MNYQLFTVLAIVATTTIMLGCAATGNESAPADLSFEEIPVSSSPPFPHADNIVVRDERTWISLWPAQRYLAQQAPTIDFDHKMVLGVNLGCHAAGEAPKLSVRSIKKRSHPSRIEIAYSFTNPRLRWGFGGQGCQVQHQFVSTARSELPVEFVDVPQSEAELHNVSMNAGGRAADYPPR